MPTESTAAWRAAVNALRDGQWHDRELVIQAVVRKVPPGMAHRTAELRRRTSSPNRDQRQQARSNTQLVQIGARFMASRILTQSIFEKRPAGRAQPGVRIEVRLTPAALRRLIQKSAGPTFTIIEDAMLECPDCSERVPASDGESVMTHWCPR